MTFVTGHFGMCSVERELRIAVMHKGEFFPALGSVATRTIGVDLPFFQELALMRILVAGIALDVNGLHPHHSIGRADLLDHVAGETRFLLMLANQRKAAELVVKGGAVPCLRVVAILTAALRDPLIELAVVRVFVTALACEICKIEARVAAGFLLYGRVTGKTGNGKMTSGERVA